MKLRWFKVLLFIFLSSFSAQAEILSVGPNAQFKTISQAIAAASNGDAIRVEAGNYTENIVLDKSLILEGSGKPVLSGTGKGSVITITADGCAVRGFRVEKSGGDLQGEDSGILLKSNGNTVEDNELKDILYGIYLLHSAGNFIRRNTVTGRAELESGERGAGLHLWNSPNNVLEENVISYARDGMYIQSSANNRIHRNRVFNLRYGLHYMNSDDNSFEDNWFYDNVAGAAIMYSQNIELRRNFFVRNRGFSSFGILYQDCRRCVTEENLILNNATGVFLEGLKNSVFRRNTIAENDVAMQIFASSEANTFVQNNFIDNLSPLQLVGKGSSTRWHTNDGGNYWSDYDGYDLDGDGIGDAPYKIQNIFEYLEGNFPRLRVYLNSPAAQSVVVAERSFPILKGSEEFDPKPLMRVVEIGMTFTPNKPNNSANLILLAFSVLMLGFSGAIIKRGFKR
jgi:nitrous oxidase accessory protein